MATSARVWVARDLAQALLSDERWHQTVGVANRAQHLLAAVPAVDRETLLVAAWLRDIGYHPTLHLTGFYPFDGARYLDQHRWPHRIAALVARHSGAGFVAEALDLGDLLATYPDERSPVTDALSYADQTVGRDGQRLTIRQRLSDTVARHGPDSPQARVAHVRAPYLVAAAQRVEGRLRGCW
jgi:hypothetical protein